MTARRRIIRLLKRGRRMDTIPLTLIFDCLSEGFDVSAIEARYAKS